MNLISTTRDLADVCARLATHPFVAVDTEFLRETTFWPKLCVVQLAGPDEAVVVDTLADGIDLSSFFELMANESIVKVFHAGRQDIEIIWHRAKMIPHPVFDTQIAAMVLGHGDSVSYDQLVQRLTGHVIDKSSRFTDWSRRPLSPAQITYAEADVTHLRDVYQRLLRDLEKRGRSDWVAEEMAVLTSPDTYRQDPVDAWHRLKTRVRKPRELGVLIEVAEWRDREAQSRDVPRSRVMKDEVIGEIAIQQPVTPEALGQLRSLPKGFERSAWGLAILETVKRGLARDPKTLPRIERDRTPSNGAQATVELLKVLLRMTAERHAVAAKVIATVDDLEHIASDDEADVAALRGWRRELFGDKALALKHGRLALAIDRGRVVTVDKPDNGGASEAGSPPTPADP
ncbi:ribonuclease D [Blastochloris viridis]|uniref:Ribonuclease D n=1 Tax=Blastochloris viridis TaxID=1079 RepID=A0A0H5B9V6_BLAVI|nr:ribonuclease D [Blastochloris viridis]ALK08870.1 Ribonuclease D [Blastochloris viridis]BAR97829.1 ribonuclease D [Blastochloris viridis]CUU41531.1 Ribonuclease D [Blastochloris viridis]